MVGVLVVFDHEPRSQLRVGTDDFFVTGITTTKMPITIQAPQRRATSPSVVERRCNAYSTNGAASRTAVMIPSRNANA